MCLRRNTSGEKQSVTLKKNTRELMPGANPFDMLGHSEVDFESKRGTVAGVMRNK